MTTATTEAPTKPTAPTPEDWGKMIFESHVVWLKEQGFGYNEWETLDEQSKKLYTEFLYTLCRMSQKSVLSHFMGVAQALMAQSRQVKGLQNRKERQASIKGVLVGLKTFNGMVTLQEMEDEMERAEQAAATIEEGATNAE